MSEITLYKVTFNINGTAGVQGAIFRETEKSYITTDSSSSRLANHYSRLNKNELGRFLIGHTPQEAVKLAYEHYKRRTSEAQYELQKYEGKLNAVEMI